MQSDELRLPDGSPLAPLIERQRTLVVFLRHHNCTFCREAIADVGAARRDIEAEGAAIAFVYPSSPEEAQPWFERAGLGDVTRVSDPTLAHYRAFGLQPTGAGALFAPDVWARGAVCALRHGFGVQPPSVLRLRGGTFVAHRGRLLAAVPNRNAAQRPDYRALVAGTASKA
jgi:hypothetical protein